MSESPPHHDPDVSRRMAAYDAALGMFNVRDKEFEPNDVLRCASAIDRFFRVGEVSKAELREVS